MEPDEEPMPVRICRLRKEIGADPAAAGRPVRGELMYQALAGLEVDAVRDVDALVGVLVDDADPVVRGSGLRLLRDGVRGGALTPGRARARLDRLVRPGSAAAAAEAEVLVGALRELAEPWAVLEPFPAERLRRSWPPGTRSVRQR